MGMSLNPISFTTQRVTPRLIQYVAEARPTTLTVMNDPVGAISLAERYPLTKIIHRHIPVADWDKNAHLKYSPHEFYVTAAAQFKGTPVLTYVMNETILNEASAKWVEDVAHLLVVNGQGGVLFNFGVGRPEPEEIPLAAGSVELINSHENLYLGLHEYWAHHWKNDLDWHVRRFRFWLDAFKFRERSIIFTEWGWDTIDDQGGAWKKIGIAEREAFLQFTSCWDKIYGPHPEMLGVQAYLWETIDPQWNDFRYADAKELVTDLTNWSPKIPLTPDPSPTEGRGEVPDAGGDGGDTGGDDSHEEIEPMPGKYVIGGLGESVLNVRSAPAGEIVGTLADGDVVTLADVNPQWEFLGLYDYLWHQTADGNWIAMVSQLTLEPYEPAAQVDVAALERQLRLLRVEVNDWIDGMLARLTPDPAGAMYRAPTREE